MVEFQEIVYCTCAVAATNDRVVCMKWKYYHFTVPTL